MQQCTWVGGLALCLLMPCRTRAAPVWPALILTFLGAKASVCASAACCATHECVCVCDCMYVCMCMCTNQCLPIGLMIYLVKRAFKCVCMRNACVYVGCRWELQRPAIIHDGSVTLLLPQLRRSSCKHDLVMGHTSSTHRAAVPSASPTLQLCAVWGTTKCEMMHLHSVS